jgi:hypothetical protein
MDMSIYEQQGTRSRTPIFPRDIADFHLRWTEFRPFALELLSSTNLTAHQTETLKWMVALSDRVGAEDVRD